MEFLYYHINGCLAMWDRKYVAPSRARLAKILTTTLTIMGISTLQSSMGPEIIYNLLYHYNTVMVLLIIA